MVYTRTLLFTLLTCLSCVHLQAQHIEVLSDSTHFSTSYDDNYNIKLHIEEQYIYVDQVPEKEVFNNYIFGIKNVFNLESRGYRVPPVSADWLIYKEHKPNKTMRISCKGLKDGLYEAALYIKKRRQDKYWNYTQPYDIVIKVQDKKPVFMGKSEIQKTKDILSSIPTDSAFLEKCLQPTKKMKINNPVFTQLKEQLTLGTDSPREHVQRAADWVAYRLVEDKSFGPEVFKEVDALTAIKQKQTTPNGFAVVMAATLRALGIPAILAPIKGLEESAKWFSKSKFSYSKRKIVLAYYDEKWRLIDAKQNNDEYIDTKDFISATGWRTVYKGVDMTIPHFCNRSELLYANDFKLAVESYRNPIEIDNPVVVALPTDSIDALSSSHLITSYCQPYTIRMHVEEDNKIALDHLPQLSNFTTWESTWTSLNTVRKTTKFDKKKSIYDNASWDFSKWQNGLYEFNLYDADRLGYATKACIRLTKDEDGVQFVTDEEGEKKNRQALKAIPMTTAKRREMLKTSLYYNTKDTAIVRVAKAITKGMTDDYEKMAAIHRWVSTNIYFDKDVYKTHKDFHKYNKVALVMKNRRCVGNGFAYVACSMMRAVGIPAVGLLNKLKKKAPGASGHVILIAYYKGRWVIMDPASDSWNKYENGEFQPQLSTPNRMLYFDTTLAFMSQFRELQKPLDYGLKAKVKIQRKRYVKRRIVRKRS